MVTNLVNQLEIPKIGCDKCDGFGNIITPQGLRTCDCKIRAVTVTHLVAAEIPPMYAKKSFKTFDSDFPETDVYDKCVKYVLKYYKGEKGLLLHGKCGTGKTHLAIAILRELIQKGYTGLFYNVISLLDDLRSTYALDNTLTQWPILEKVCRVDILVLDDLGAEKTSGWVNDRLYAIINQRYEQEKATIVTTNKNDKELEEQVGTRIESRLKEMCQWLRIEGNDYRIQMMKSGKG